MSSLLHPLDKSLIGFAIPCVIGPYAFALAILSVILYAIFAASIFGKIRTFASPFNGLLGALDFAISGIIAASNCNSPSKQTNGYFSLNTLW